MIEHVARLKDYGQFIALYEGTGTLDFPLGEQVDCSFEAGQLGSGHVLLVCQSAAQAPEQQSAPPVQFRGESTRGYEVRADKLTVAMPLSFQSTSGRDPSGTFLYRAEGLTLKTGAGAPRRRVRFGIVNLLFSTNQTARILPTGKAFPVLPISVNHCGRLFSLRIQPVANYKRIERRLGVTKSPEVTCEIICEIDQGDAEFFNEVIDNVCYVLSVASGTKVNWLYGHFYNDGDQCTNYSHREAITKPFVPLSTIPLDDAHIKEFVEGAYATYVGRKADFALDQGVVDAYLDARSDVDYLQMRGAKLAVALEMLKSVFLSIPEAPIGSHILPPQDFKEMRKDIKDAIGKVLKSRRIDEQTRAIMYQGIDELDRRPFMSILQGLFRYLDLRLDDKELRQFVDSRNKLVHEGRFYCEVATDDEKKTWPFGSPREEYRFMLGLLDRVYLRLLGYDGPYIDWSSVRGPVHRDRVNYT